MPEPECICGGGHSAYVDDLSPGAGHAVNCPVRIAHPYRPAGRAQEPTPDQLAEKVLPRIEHVNRIHPPANITNCKGCQAEAALSELVSRLTTAQQERDEARRELEHARTFGCCQLEANRRLESAEADRDEVTAELAKLLAEFKLQRDDRDRLAAALEQYADPLHWGIQRDEFKHPSAVWIGPGATETPHPNPMQVAREALNPGNAT